MSDHFEHYDAAIIGTGQSGKPLAFELASEGLETAVIERDEIGGSCINYGCTPTKTMVASGKVAYLSGRSEEFGVRTGDIDLDMETVVSRKDHVVDMFRSGSERSLKKKENIELIRGHARFTDDKTLEIDTESGDGRELTADQIFINTGLKPRIPDLSGIEDVPYLTSTTILELQAVPEHLLVIGGGYIGLEFGQMFRRFGSEVTIFQRKDQLVPREDRDIAEKIREILEEDGIRVRTDTEPEKVRTKEEGIALTFTENQTRRAVSGSHLLLAAGRVPATDQLGLEQTSVETNDRGFIQVNERLKTAGENIYALGDVKGGPAFTHISYDDYRVIRENLFGDGATIDGRMVPYTLFIDPELGRIGLNETLARKRNQPYRKAEMPMTRVARALERSETRGKMKVLVGEDTDQILGASVLGIEGGEIASMIQIAMMGDLPYTALRDGIFSHPTLAESLNNLFSSL